MNPTPTTEDRIWAVLSHLSALAFGMGIALPIVGWADQRGKSRYASFQSLQALGYQSLGFTLWILSYLLVITIVSLILLVVLGSGRGESETPDATLTLWILGVFIVLFGLFAIYFLLPIIGAIACALGRDFRYPMMGDRLARYLGYDPGGESEQQAALNEDREFRWVAAMGHFSILIFLWGMLAPLTAWILYGKHSFFLRFQSIQTLVYQALTTVVYFIALFLYFFGFLLLVTVMGWMGGFELNPPVQIAIIGVLSFSLLISFVLIFLIPLLHIIGQWAGYRILKHENYRYPLVGGLVERWITPHESISIDHTLNPKGKSS